VRGKGRVKAGGQRTGPPTFWGMSGYIEWEKLSRKAPHAGTAQRAREWAMAPGPPPLRPGKRN